MGAVLGFDDFLLEGFISPPKHVHPRQQDRFDVISGSLGVRIAGHEQVLGAGKTAAVPSGTPHIPDLVKGPEGIKFSVALYRAAFPDLHINSTSPTGPDDLIFTPAAHTHGFSNTSAEEVLLLWGWRGACSLETAGYDLHGHG